MRAAPNHSCFLLLSFGLLLTHELLIASIWICGGPPHVVFCRALSASTMADRLHNIPSYLFPSRLICTAGVVQHLEALAKKEDLTGPTPDEESEGGEQQQGSHGKGIFARWLGK